MRTSDKIFILIYNLPILIFTGLFLSSELCDLNNWAAWGISVSLYFNRAYTDLVSEQLKTEIDNLKE